MILKLALAVQLLAQLAASGQTAGAARSAPRSSASEGLYKCGLDLWGQLPASEIVLSIHYLPTKTSGSELGGPTSGHNPDGLILRRLNFNASQSELRVSELNPKLPFRFFINGFNYDNKSNTSWLHNVGRIAARPELRSRGQSPACNWIFLSWEIDSLITSNTMSMIPAYYKTMANYDLILDYITDNILNLVNYVDGANSWLSRRQRDDYYEQFHFYGHSLGSHIMADSIRRIRAQRPDIRFGKLTGLDPAIPCFASESHGISATKLADALKQVVVVHSNAAIVAVDSERGQVEIVLNGGTFQPSCSWYDLECHHTRSTDILNYYDDRCQMVAYKCRKYEQFKHGACETCDQADSSSAGNGSYTSSATSADCILVNLPEQHFNDDETRWSGASGLHQRPAAGRRAEIKSAPRFEPVIHHKDDLLRARKSYYYYVNTSPNFRQIKSHCLQHYQARLLVLDGRANSVCPINSFYRVKSNGIQVTLMYEDATGQTWRKPLAQGATRQTSSERNYRKKLTGIIDGKLHTGLVNFDGKPELFVGAELVNIDYEGWSECLRVNQQVAPDKINFVLDVAFMSHIKQK